MTVQRSIEELDEQVRGVIEKICLRMHQDGIPLVVCANVLVTTGCKQLVHVLGKNETVEFLREHIKRLDGMSAQEEQAIMAKSS